MSYIDLKPLILSKIKAEDFPEDKYYPNEYQKKQIVLHHTVSGEGLEGDLRWWLKDEKRIATCMAIDRDGTPHQLFSSKYWAHHLGIPKTFLQEKGFEDFASRNVILNQESIAIEIDSWGGLQKVSDGVYKTGYGTNIKIDDNKVQHYPKGFRGYYYYEKYTEKQIRTVGELLLLWHKKYEIPLIYNEDMWDVSNNALSGKSGVWSHVSYRTHGDKQDCHPDPQLIEMLKTLNSLV